jgi:hypothetical protein
MRLKQIKQNDAKIARFAYIKSKIWLYKNKIKLDSLNNLHH